MLEIKDLKVHFPIRGGVFNTIKDYVRAVDGVDIKVEEGKTYGLIGESGSGKTTIGKVIMGLEKPTSGEIYYYGEKINKIRRKSDYNKAVQMVFQDAMSSLNPKKRVIDIIGEPISNYEKISKNELKKRVIDLLEIVGMDATNIYKYPFEFSGGQRQRIGVARSIALKPKLIVADEPVSALDLSVQAQVLNYMKKIQKEFGISYLFISHDLGVVKHMCDYIYIMYRGRIVESGTREDIYKNPMHIYTKRLISAIPDTNLERAHNIKKIREEVDRLYEQNYRDYFTEEGRVYPLFQLSDTHYVALNEVKR